MPTPPIVATAGIGPIRPIRRSYPNFGINYKTDPPIIVGPYAVTGTLEVRALSGSQATVSTSTTDVTTVKLGQNLSPYINIGANTNGNVGYTSNGPYPFKTEAEVNPAANSVTGNAILADDGVYVKTGLTIQANTHVDFVALGYIGGGALVLAGFMLLLSQPEVVFV
jgi:hypothetical protein